MSSSRVGSIMDTKELDWGASEPSRICVPSDSQAPGNQVYFLQGVGWPALQEVPEKLKATCGQLLAGSSAKNNLGREPKDSVCHPCPCRTSEGALSALHKAPLQGEPGRHLLCTSSPHSSWQASSSPGTTHCLDTPPTLPASWAQTLGVLLNCLSSLCLPSPLPTPQSLDQPSINSTW